MAVLKCSFLLCAVILLSLLCQAAAVAITANDGEGGAALLQAEGERLGELSKQVAETNRALEELLATKLRDVHYASVIGELRAEIDALR
jgi:hypothetical protein